MIILRKYVCHYCHKKIEKNLVEFQIGKKTLTTKRSHKSCRNEALRRRRFLDDLAEILDIPSVTKETVMFLDRIKSNDGYNYKCLLHALNEKRNVLLSKFTEGGMGYVITEIRGQLPMSYSAIKAEKQVKITREKNIKIIEEQKSNIETINIKSNFKKSKPILEMDDISKI